MSDCIFCRIAAGTIPAQIVYQDDQALAFDDLSPQAPVHVLLIPRKHIAVLDDAGAEDEALLGHLLGLAPRVAALKGLGGRGYRTVVNTGAEAGQSVFHLHLHVLGGRAMNWPPG